MLSKLIQLQPGRVFILSLLSDISVNFYGWFSQNNINFCIQIIFAILGSVSSYFIIQNYRKKNRSIELDNELKEIEIETKKNNRHE